MILLNLRCARAGDEVATTGGIEDVDSIRVEPDLYPFSLSRCRCGGQPGDQLAGARTGDVGGACVGSEFIKLGCAGLLAVQREVGILIRAH